MSTPTKSQSMNNDLPMNVTECPDGTLLIEWDENHPVTSVFNTWTEQDFLDMLNEACKEVLGQEEYDRIRLQHEDTK